MIGLIYIIGEENDSGLYKIGETKNLKNRIKQLQTGNPNKLVVIDKFRCINRKIFEKILHKKYESNKKLGEWFEFTDDELVACITFTKDIINNKNKTVPIHNLQSKYSCGPCNYECNNKSNFNKHNRSACHIKMLQNIISDTSDNISNFNGHMQSIPQIKMSQAIIPKTSDNKKFVCNKCDKIFASKQSVSRHRLYYCKPNEIYEIKKQISMATVKLEEIIGLLNNKVDNTNN